MTETVSEKIRLPEDIRRFERFVLCEPISHHEDSTWWVVKLQPFQHRGGTFWQTHHLELFRSTSGVEALRVQVELQTRISVLRKLEGLD